MNTPISGSVHELPEGSRYEVIDGTPYVSPLPRCEHQSVCGAICAELYQWSRRLALGRAIIAPGIILGAANEVAPDGIWISGARLRQHYGADGKLHGAPELVVEVLSPGCASAQRDRESKRTLYARIGVDEYWIADWRARTVEVYRQEHGELRLVATLAEGDTLSSPLLPGFAVSLAELWADIVGR